jgi:hypothetical protein
MSDGTTREPAALFEGHVEHLRLDPVVRRFRYPIALAHLDLDALDAAFGASRWASCDGPAPLRWRREDHFGDPRRPLADCVRERVEAETGRPLRGPVRLLTQLRHWGYGFNPASFFYCHTPDGAGLEGVLVEVTNTPWGERHLYWVGRPEGAPSTEFGTSVAKRFHVSPFMGMDSRYRFRVEAPGASLQLAIDCKRAGDRFFAARLDLDRRPWTAPELRRHALRHFARPARLHAAIHWQALRLWLAGVPFHSHPGRTADPDPALRTEPAKEASAS